MTRMHSSSGDSRAWIPHGGWSFTCSGTCQTKRRDVPVESECILLAYLQQGTQPVVKLPNRFQVVSCDSTPSAAHSDGRLRGRFPYATCYPYFNWSLLHQQCHMRPSLYVPQDVWFAIAVHLNRQEIQTLATLCRTFAELAFAYKYHTLLLPYGAHPTEEDEGVLRRAAPDEITFRTFAQLEQRACVGRLVCSYSFCKDDSPHRAADRRWLALRSGWSSFWAVLRGWKWKIVDGG
jgi:hypothetical protein